MTFALPTPEQTVYRFMRLRRLIAIAVALPMIVIMSITWGDPAVLTAPHATLAMVGIAALVAAHAVLFPNGTLETLALSFSSTLLVIVMPLVKLVSLWAPAPYESGTLILLGAFAVAATGVIMALVQIALNALVYGGPLLRKTLVTELVVPCSPKVAFEQFALRPQLRRGRVLTGALDENGFFDVAVAMPEVESDESDFTANLVKLDAKVMASTAARHDVMMVMDNGSVTVCSQQFAAHPKGCKLTVSDLPGDFTVGMHGLFWLTDQQADNLTETADLVAGHDVRANNVAHHVSLLSVAGAIISPRAPVSSSAE
jgi:hypothetical protein